jgi:uncharacterized protein
VRTRHYRDLPAAPWRNGGGTTREIARGPSRHQIGFAWRVSIADVASDGPFSEFPGVTRTIAILAGKGMHLTFADGESHRLLPSSAPLTFSGGRPAHATLIDGPVVDLNAMSTQGPLMIERNGRVFDIAFEDGRGIAVEILSDAPFDCVIVER